MWKESTNRKTRTTVSLLLIAVLLALTGAACTSAPKQASLSATPFALDYKLDKSNIGFFTDNDSIETLLAASPFYAGAQPLPFQNTAAYDEARAQKVAEIKKEAESLAKAVVKLGPKLHKLRSAYFSFLDAGMAAEPKLKPFGRETYIQSTALLFEEMSAIIEYESLKTQGTDHAYAKSLMDYLKVVKAVELGNFYLEDASNLASYAGLALSSLENHQSEAVKKAYAQLDKDMKALDGLRKDLLAIAISLEKIDYGFKQLLSGSYYFALAADDFITASWRDLEAKADSLKPGEGLTQDNIDAIQVYLALFEKWQYQVKKQTELMPQWKLLKVGALRQPVPGIAYAAEPPQNYANAVDALSGTLKADEANNRNSTYFSKGWAGVKAAFKEAAIKQAEIILGVDVVEAVADAAADSIFGEAPKTLPDLQREAATVGENYGKYLAGVKTVQSGESYLRSTETASAPPVETVGAALSSHVGAIAKTTVGLFTRFAEGVELLVDPKATIAEDRAAMRRMGLEDIAVSMVGGAKVIVKGAQLTDLSVDLAWQASVAGEYMIEFLESVDTRLTGPLIDSVNNSLAQFYGGVLLSLAGDIFNANKAGIAAEKAKSVRPFKDTELFKQWQEYAQDKAESWLPEGIPGHMYSPVVPSHPDRILVLPDQRQDARERIAALPSTEKDFGPAPVAGPKPGPTARPTTPTARPTPPGPTSKPTPKPTLSPVLTSARDLTGTWKGTGVFYQRDYVSGERARKITAEITFRIEQKGDAVTVHVSQGEAKFEPPGSIEGRGYWWSVRSWKREVDARARNPELFTRYPVAQKYEEIVGSPLQESNGPVDVMIELERNRSPLHEGDKRYFDLWTLRGTASATTLYLEHMAAGEGPVNSRWDFTFTTDLMSGGFKLIDPKTWGPRYEGDRYVGIEFESDPKGFNLVRQK